MKTVYSLSQRSKLIAATSSVEWGDQIAPGEEGKKNRETFLTSLGIKFLPVFGQQVHGGQVKVVSHEDEGVLLKEVDGLVTAEPEVCLAVRTADCVPVLIWDPLDERIGLAHAGWRGLCAGIVTQLVKKMTDEGSLVSELELTVGPYLNVSCAHFKEPEASFVRAAFSDQKGIIVPQENDFLIDLGLMVATQAVEAGLSADRVNTQAPCTFCDERWYSYRRQKDSAEFGEMMTAVMVQKESK